MDRQDAGQVSIRCIAQWSHLQGSLTMGPMSCLESSVRNLPIYAASYPRRTQISLISCRNPEIRQEYSEGPATGHLDTGFSRFPCVYKQTLRRFPTFQVATTYFSCSPAE